MQVVLETYTVHKRFDQINNLLLTLDREMNFNISNFASPIYNYLRQFFFGQANQLSETEH